MTQERSVSFQHDIGTGNFLVISLAGGNAWYEAEAVVNGIVVPWEQTYRHGIVGQNDMRVFIGATTDAGLTGLLDITITTWSSTVDEPNGSGGIVWSAHAAGGAALDTSYARGGYNSSGNAIFDSGTAHSMGFGATSAYSAIEPVNPLEPLGDYDLVVHGLSCIGKPGYASTRYAWFSTEPISLPGARWFGPGGVATSRSAVGLLMVELDGSQPPPDPDPDPDPPPPDPDPDPDPPPPDPDPAPASTACCEPVQHHTQPGPDGLYPFVHFRAEIVVGRTEENL